MPLQRCRNIKITIELCSMFHAGLRVRVVKLPVPVYSHHFYQFHISRLLQLPILDGKVFLPPGRVWYSACVAAWRLGIPVLPLEENFTRPEHERRTHLHRQFQFCSRVMDDDDDDDDDIGYTIIHWSYMLQHLFPHFARRASRAFAELRPQAVVSSDVVPPWLGFRMQHTNPRHFVSD